MVAMNRLSNRIDNIVHGHGNNPNPMMNQPVYNSGISSQPAYYNNGSHVHVDVDGNSMQPIYGPYQ